MSNGQAHLRRALLEPPGGHLDDDMLALLATLEAAGENIDQHYPVEVAHLETCVTCAEAYAQLMALMLTAVGDMEAAAERYDPQANLQHYLQEALDAELQAAPELKRELEAWLETAPATLTQIDTQEVERALPTTGLWSPSFRARLTQALSQRLTWLRDYALATAQTAWDQAFTWQAEPASGWYHLRLQPLPAKSVPLLSTRQVGAQREVVATRTPGPLGLNLVIVTQALDALRCQLLVSVDRPGLSQASGRVVELRYGGAVGDIMERTAVTDERGIAEFDEVPIAALPHLSVTIQLS